MWHLTFKMIHQEKKDLEASKEQYDKSHSSMTAHGSLSWRGADTQVEQSSLGWEG